MNKKAKKICEQCGEVITGEGKRFCSRRCKGLWQSENRRGENGANWKGGKIKKTCGQCGTGFDVFPSERNQKFCSKECVGLWRSENVRGEKHPRWQGGRTATIICKQCGVTLRVLPHLADTKKFCSRRCKGLWRSENMSGKNSPRWEEKVNLNCEQCGEEFSVVPSWADQRFCSLRCKGLWQSETNVGENNPSWKEKVKLNCEWCGEEFETYPSRANKARFCSLACKGLWMSENRVGENNPSWRGGTSFEPYGPDWTDTLKEEVRKRDDYTCAISGEVWQLGQEKFPVHHINYCKTDNLTGNLITLCIKCHGKTNRNRKHWQALLAPVAEMRAIGERA